MWKISRYWNRFAFLIIRLGELMIWDQTKKNQDLLDDLVDETAKAILCNKG